MPLATGDANLPPGDATADKITPAQIQRAWKLIDAFLKWSRKEERKAEKEAEGENQQETNDEVGTPK